MEGKRLRGTRESELGWYSVCEEGCHGEGVLFTRVPDLLNQQKLIRGWTRNSGKAFSGSLLQQRNQEQIIRSLVCLLPKAGWTGSLYGVRVRKCSGVRLEGCLRRWCVQGAGAVPCFCSQPPVFAPGSSEVAMRLFSLLYLWSRICPNCLPAQQLFLVPYCFFLFSCSRRHLSRYKHCRSAVKGARSHAHHKAISSVLVCCCLVAKLCLTLWGPINRVRNI